MIFFTLSLVGVKNSNERKNREWTKTKTERHSLPYVNILLCFHNFFGGGLWSSLNISLWLYREEEGVWKKSIPAAFRSSSSCRESSLTPLECLLWLHIIFFISSLSCPSIRLASLSRRYRRLSLASTPSSSTLSLVPSTSPPPQYPTSSCPPPAPLHCSMYTSSFPSTPPPVPFTNHRQQLFPSIAIHIRVGLSAPEAC